MTDGLAPAPVEVELKYRMSDIEPGQRLLAADELAGLVALGPPSVRLRPLSVMIVPASLVRRRPAYPASARAASGVST